LTNLNILISQVNVTTYLRCDGKYYMAFIVKFMILSAVKKEIQNRLRFDKVKAGYNRKSLRRLLFDSSGGHKTTRDNCLLFALNENFDMQDRMLEY